MTEVTGSTTLRQRDIWPAREPAPLAPPMQKLLELGQANLAEPFVGITADGTPVPDLFRLDPTGETPQPVVDAANAFLASLSATQARTALFPLESDVWRSWSNVHPYLMRHGVCLADLDDAQRTLALELLRASLSPAGYATARKVMKLNHHIMELTARAEEYGEWPYWVSIMGTPSSTEPWGWQIDGHHLIVNCLVLRDQTVLTPIFMGTEPEFAASGKYAGTRVLAEEEAAGLAVMGAFSPEQRRQATIGDNPPSDVFATAAHDNLILPYQGLAYRDMAAAAQAKLDHLVKLYMERGRAGQAERWYADMLRHRGDTWFAWIGRFSDEAPFYYRVHNPVILIEFGHVPGIAFANDAPSRRHIHTLVRTPNGNDYGKDMLRQYFATAEVQRPSAENLDD